jgi:hypothetical protein
VRALQSCFGLSAEMAVGVRDDAEDEGTHCGEY